MVTLALIADDLTGAADSGVQFAKRGFPAMLVLDPKRQHTDARIIVVDTESRADAPATAYAKAHAIASLLPPASLVYKKIDSTLRGNPGSELEAIMEAADLDRAVVAPAFPAAGRTTVGGHQLLNGQPLEHTAFAKDPLCPITDSYIPTLLSSHMRRTVGLIELAVVRTGPDALAGAVRGHPESVLVVDAITDQDLRTIAQAIQASAVRLACGSAGLADAVAEVVLDGRPDAARPVSTGPQRDAPANPVVVMAASRNPLTAAQLSYAAQEADVALLPIDACALATRTSTEIHRLTTQARQELSVGRSVALTATNSTYVQGLGTILLQAFGAVAAQLTGQHALAGLVLTGGDTALAVCQALDTHALSLIGEVAPGIPLARLEDGPHSGLCLVTKAGGFGELSAIVTAIHYLQHMMPSAARPMSEVLSR